MKYIFQVKSIVTPKRVSVTICSVFIILALSVIPVYSANRLGVKFFPAKNKSLIGIVFTGDKELVEKVSYGINNVLIPFSAFLLIMICTVILVAKLQKTTKWRKTSAASAQGEVVSSRNQKVSRMVVMISVLFIICFIPVSILFIAMSVMPELSIVGKHRNIVITVGGLAVILESINSSMNIFIYYKMSTKYRNVLLSLFCGEKTKTAS